MAETVNLKLDFNKDKLLRLFGPPVLTKPELDAEYETITEFSPFVLVIKKDNKERGTFQFENGPMGRLYFHYAMTNPWTPCRKTNRNIDDDEAPPIVYKV